MNDKIHLKDMKISKSGHGLMLYLAKRFAGHLNLSAGDVVNVTIEKISAPKTEQKEDETPWVIPIPQT